MKKSLLVLFSIIFLAAAANVSMAKPAATNPQTSAAIKLYKSGNYTLSYKTFSEIVSKDPGNALAQYYLGMSAVRLGKSDEAIEHYSSAAALSPNGILGSYAKRGIRCIEEPSRCHESVSVVAKDEEETDEDRFIKGKFGTGFSNKARGVYEQEKIKHIQREMNRDAEIEPKTFKEYKNFSSQAPSNEEIAAALEVLQRAGMNNIDNSDYSALSLLLGESNRNNNAFDALNMLYNGNRGNSDLSPQVIQSLITSQMTANF